MNKQTTESARDAGLRLSGVAMKRAALRARELAQKTGTAIVVSRNGQIEHLRPESESSATIVQEPAAPYGGKR